MTELTCKTNGGKRCLFALLHLDLVLAGGALCVLVCVTFMGVIFRYFLNSPIIWQEELQLMCFVWMIYFGCSAAVRSGSHVAIDMLVARMPPPVRRVIEAIIYLVIVFVLGYLLMKSIVLINQLANSNRMTNILKIPYKFIYTAVPVGCALTVLNYGADYFRRVFMTEYEGSVEH